MPMLGARGALFALFLALHCVPAAISAESALPLPPALFGTPGNATYPLVQMQSSGIIQRWHKVMEQHLADDAFAPGNHAMIAPMRKQWDALVAAYAAMTPEERLRAINAFFNLIPGGTDQHNYGQQEYWAYPAEFIRKNSGDCEDYALAKYLALRHLGWPEKDLHLVLVKDLQRKTDHAVLAVTLGGRILILDNLSRPRDLVMPQEKYARVYTPLLAINGDEVWNYTMTVKAQPGKPSR